MRTLTWHPLGSTDEEEAHDQHTASARRHGAGRSAPRGPRRRGILVAACAAPGAVATPSPAATAAPTARAIGGSAKRGTVGDAAAAGPDCGTDPVELNAYFETGFDIPFKLSEEFTKQYPNVTWNISQDQFTNLMTATPRLLRVTTRRT